MLRVPDIVQPYHLDGMVALIAASTTPTHRLRDEMDTAFIKRIVCAYVNASHAWAAAGVKERGSDVCS